MHLLLIYHNHMTQFCLFTIFVLSFNVFRGVICNYDLIVWIIKGVTKIAGNVLLLGACRIGWPHPSELQPD